MLTPDTPVYFVHAVVNHRLFVAAWARYQDCLAEDLPVIYALIPESDPLPVWIAAYQLLECEPARKVRLYRKTRQAELPLHWQARIQAEQMQLRHRRAYQPLPPEFRETPFATATPENLKTLYRQLARRLHPDQGGTTGDFLALRQAYEALCRYWGL